MKLCTGCKLKLKNELFYKYNGKLYHICKDCNKRKNRRYTATHKQQKAEYDKAYGLRNKEKRLAYNRRWVQANKDKISAYRRAWWANHKEKNREYYQNKLKAGKAYNRDYYRLNRDRILEYHRRYYAENKATKRLKHKEWEQRNRVKLNAYRRRSRELPKSAYSSDYLQPLGEAATIHSGYKDRYYTEKLRSGAGISPSPEWQEEWNRKAKQNNDRIIAKYSPSPEPVEVSKEEVIIVS